MSDRPAGENEGNVVPLGTDPPVEHPEAPSPPGRLHGLAIAGMASSALVAIVAGFLFIAVGWPDNTGKIVASIGFFAGISFLAFASAAVFTAARDTYARSDHRRRGDAG